MKQMTTQDQVNLAIEAIHDKKGSNVVAVDIRQDSSVTDYVIVAEGSIGRHVVAIAQEVTASLKAQGIVPVHQEGLSDGDWVALDYSDFIVHILTPDMRAFYQIERIWPEGKILG